MTDTEREQAGLPAPLVPPEVDLQDFAFMPLDVARLRDSDLASDETPEACWAAVLLWCASWHQIPAASIPNSDMWIAKQAGYASRGRIDPSWRKVRAGALRNWVACSDGRLYHPVVAEKALDAWRSKLEQRWRTESGRVKKHNQRHDLTGDRAVQMLDIDEWIAAGCPQGHALPVPKDNAPASPGTDAQRPREVPGETPSKRQGEGQGQIKGQGQGQGDLRGEIPSPPLPPTAGGASPPAAAPSRRLKPVTAEPPPTAEAWSAYSGAYRERYRVDPVRNAKVNAQLAQLVQRLGAHEAPQVAAFFVASNRGLYVSAKHPVDLLVRDAEGLRTEWATGRTVTEAEARMADGTQARGNVWGKLIEEAGHGSD